MAEEVTRQRRYPCGICTKVCPIGADRKLYRQQGIGKKYLREKEALAGDPDHPDYRSWQHIRRYGAKNP
jgi:heterodisulfide reductase subunit C